MKAGVGSRLKVAFEGALFGGAHVDCHEQYCTVRDWHYRRRSTAPRRVVVGCYSNLSVSRPSTSFTARGWLRWTTGWPDTVTRDCTLSHTVSPTSARRPLRPDLPPHSESITRPTSSLRTHRLAQDTLDTVSTPSLCPHHPPTQSEAHSFASAHPLPIDPRCSLQGRLTG